jgi:acetyltransferase-like isoleucine patch superfamily enzyme
MSFSLGAVVLRLKRADTPFFRVARKIYDFVWTANLPVPRFLKPVGRLFYEIRFGVILVWRRLKSLIYIGPLFSCRCEVVGRRLQSVAMPDVRGHALIYIGDDVRLGRNLTMTSGRFWDGPILRIGNRTSIGHSVTITCNREVVIEDDVLIAGNCRISDYDGHPSAMEKRISRSTPDPEDMRPVRICKGAWIGHGALILKGVTIGEGAIVGANSVVTHDVPPHSVVAGPPAKVVKPTGAAGSESAAKLASVDFKS